jgi:hypothetical protein
MPDSGCRSPRKAKWLVDSWTSYGVSPSWFPWLGTAKAAGAAGLLVGLGVPIIGTLAGIGLVLYFIGAVITVVRARWYSHIPAPLLFLMLVAVSMALGREA